MKNCYTTIARNHVQLVVCLIQVDDRPGPIWSWRSSSSPCERIL